MKNKIIALLLTFLLFFVSMISTEQAMAASEDASVPEAKTEAMTLDKAKETALLNNREILASKERIEQADYKIQENQSGYWPKLVLGGSYNYTPVVPSIDISIPAGYGKTIDKTIETGAADNWVFQAGLNETIFDWGRTSAGVDAATANRDFLQADADIISGRVLYNTIDAFNRVILARNVLNLNDEMLRNAKSHLEKVKLQFSQGTSSAYDKLTAEVQVSTLQPMKTQAVHNVESAELNLKNILGLPLNGTLSLAGALSEPSEEKIDLNESIELAKSIRPELARANYRKAQKNALLDAVRSTNRPVLSTNARYQYQYPYYSEIEWKNSWSVGLSISYPLFDGWAVGSQINESDRDIKISDIETAQIANQVELEVRQAVLKLDEARERISGQKELVRQAEELLKITETSFENGASTEMEVADSRLALHSAKINYFQALFDYALAKAAWEKATGRLK